VFKLKRSTMAQASRGGGYRGFSPRRCPNRREEITPVTSPSARSSRLLKRAVGRVKSSLGGLLREGPPKSAGGGSSPSSRPLVIASARAEGRLSHAEKRPGAVTLAKQLRRKRPRGARDHTVRSPRSCSRSATPIQTAFRFNAGFALRGWGRTRGEMSGLRWTRYRYRLLPPISALALTTFSAPEPCMDTQRPAARHRSR
jgi:hypothetical protein